MWGVFVKNYLFIETIHLKSGDKRFEQFENFSRPLHYKFQFVKR